MNYLPAESDSGCLAATELARAGLDAGECHPYSCPDHLYYGDNFKIECPTGSGKMMNPRGR